MLKDSKIIRPTGEKVAMKTQTTAPDGSGQVMYHIEMPAVKHGTERLTERLEIFAAKYERVIHAGHSASLTDNAMGKLAFQGHELIQELRLPVPAGQVIVHLNTFHSRAELHHILEVCGNLAIRDLLVISGDGSIRLPKLQPAELGSPGEAVTSVELLAYIRRCHGDFFRIGVAFNQYDPPAHEEEKLRRKLDAGARFVITQPVLAPTPAIDRLRRELPVPLILEAWMSAKIELLSACVGCELVNDGTFDPLATLKTLERHYAGSQFYLALLNFAKQFDLLAGGRP